MKRISLILLLGLSSTGRADWNQFAGRDNVTAFSSATYAPRYTDASSRTYAPSYTPTATYAPAFTYAPIIAPEPVPPARPTRLARPRYSDQEFARLRAELAEQDRQTHAKYLASLLGVDPVAVLPFLPQEMWNGVGRAPTPALVGAPVGLHVRD
jgi:hypothetical protein